MQERKPRDWLRTPARFGLDYEAALVSRPASAVERADRRAARLQNAWVHGLRVRIGRVQEPPSLRAISSHRLFPYGYDALTKCLKGRQWMSTRVYAAIGNVLDDLGESRRRPSPLEVVAAEVEVEGVPREWLSRPKRFGLDRDAGLLEGPVGALSRAEWAASAIQNRWVYELRTRMGQLDEPPSLRSIADHRLYPYSYDTLTKSLRGQHWMSTRVYAALANVLEDIGSPRSPKAGGSGSGPSLDQESGEIWSSTSSAG